MKINYTKNNKTKEIYMVDPGNGYWYNVSLEKLSNIDTSEVFDLNFIEFSDDVRESIEEDSKILKTLRV